MEGVGASAGRGLVVRETLVLRAPASRVWEALTDPARIKAYLFGTEVVADWRVGGEIRYRGSWQGRTYEDKGTVLRLEPGRLLETTYWSSLAGLPDRAESYKRVTWELEPADGGTRLTLSQDNNATEEERAHAARNWRTVLEGLRSLVEGG